MSQSSSTSVSGDVNFASKQNPWLIGALIVAVVVAIWIYKRK